MRTRLQEHVSEVRVSSRLTSSPSCLVLPEGGLPPHLERLLRSTQPEAAKQKRILEINPDHALITGLVALIEAKAEDVRIDRYVDLVHAQALLAEGSPPENPAELAKSFAELLTESVARG
jgi:molecular chaperone HtpG